MSIGKAILASLRQQLNLTDYRKTHWEGGFEEYLDIVREHPEVTRTAYQRLYDMIISHGTEEVLREQGEDHPLQVLHRVRRQARRRHLRPRPAADAAGQRLQVGRQGLRHRAPRAAAARPGRLAPRAPSPACSSAAWKTTRAPTRAWSSASPGSRSTTAACGRSAPCTRTRCTWSRWSCGRRCWPGSTTATSRATTKSPSAATSAHSAARCTTNAWPSTTATGTGCSSDVKVYRLILSEQDRIGIGTFQPKDEKNQDSTELTGDINYRKIAEYGTDSDPRAFNFDGELNIANRGLVEFIEVLKLDVAFLYDLLGASQEHKIKPKKFAQTDIDEVILGHTNEPEYRRLQNNEFMEALARPHREDRRALRHPAQGRDQDLREGLQHRAGEGQAHRAAHDRDRGHVGGADAAGAAQARQPDAVAEAQALQRQDAARLHRGQRRRAEARGDERGHDRHQPALHPGQDQQRPRRPPRRGQRQPVHGDARAGSRPAAPLADHQPGAAAALQASCSPWSRRSTRTS